MMDSRSEGEVEGEAAAAEGGAAAADMQAPEEGSDNEAGHEEGRGRAGGQGPRCSCTCSTDIIVAAARGTYGDAPSSGIGGAPTRRTLLRPHMFALRVPFPSPLEAQIAHGSLAPDAEPHQAVINKQLTVRGNILAIKWIAEDARLLRISIINCLEHLSLVLRTMQHFGPPIPR